MSDETKTEGAGHHDPEDLETEGYKAPEKKTMDEIMNLDKDDEALERYKVRIIIDKRSLYIDTFSKHGYSPNFTLIVVPLVNSSDN
jgi:hypothetical protein